MYPTGSLPREARAFFEATFGIEVPSVHPGRLPTRVELIETLDSMEEHTVRHSELGGSWQVDVQSTRAPDDWTTIVVMEAPSASGDAPADFYFEKGSLEVIISVLDALAKRVGTLLLVPHSCHVMVLCTPDAAPQICETA